MGIRGKAIIFDFPDYSLKANTFVANDSVSQTLNFLKQALLSPFRSCFSLLSADHTKT